MATQVQRRKGTTVQHSTFTGASAELTVDTTKNTVVVHNGATAGGFPLAKDSEVAHLTGAETIAGVKTLSSNPILSAGTANGVTYLNGSKVLTSGSALTFDGSKLVASGGNEAIRIASVSPYYSFFNTAQTTRFGYIQHTGTDLALVNEQNGAIPFYTNNTEQMRLTSTGLGIGTSSPTQKLTVLNSNGAYGTAYQPAVQIGNASSGGTVSANTGLGAIVWSTDSLATPVASIEAIRENPGSGAASSLAFRTGASGGGTEKMRLDSSGNLGLGVTPSAWYVATANARTFQINNASFYADTNNGVSLASNWLFDTAGAQKYLSNGYATRFLQTAGQYQWLTAPSGTAGAAISFTQAMTLTAAGDLCVGGTSSLSTATGRTDLTVNGASSGGIISFGTAGVRRAYLYQDNTDFTISNETAGVIRFLNNGSERARIDSSGNLLVGTTTTSVVANGGTNIRGPNSGGSSSILLGHISGTETGNSFAEFTLGGIGGLGSITQNGTTGVLYNVTSDYRLKTVIGPVANAGQRIDALQPVEYTWNASGERTRGFLAHKFQEVYAGSVSGTKDAVDAEGKPVYQSMQASTSEVIADLVAEIQSLRQRLAALEAA